MIPRPLRTAIAATVLFSVMSAFLNGLVAQPANGRRALETTRYLEFHSNAWINLHHYLFQLAKGRQGAELPATLTDEERSAFESAREYYRKNLIQHDLLFNGKMFRFKRWVIRSPADRPLESGGFESEWISNLNAVRPVYLSRLWPGHDRQNRATMRKNLVLIREMERPAFEKLAMLAQTGWPPDRVRIDLTVYSNWAGAYTTTRPRIHAVVQTGDEGPPGEWIELVFHEPCHYLIGNDRGPVADVIGKVTADLDKPAPRGLWHSILFYFAGRVTQDLLSERGIEYEQMMVRGKIFEQHIPFLRRHLEPYLQGETDLESAVRRIIEDI